MKPIRLIWSLKYLPSTLDLVQYIFISMPWLPLYYIALWCTLFCISTRYVHTTRQEVTIIYSELNSPAIYNSSLSLVKFIFELKLFSLAACARGFRCCLKLWNTFWHRVQRDNHLINKCVSRIGFNITLHYLQDASRSIYSFFYF